MIDEMMMRGWNEGHGQFSADTHRGLSRLAAGLGAITKRGMKLPRRAPRGPTSVR